MLAAIAAIMLSLSQPVFSVALVVVEHLGVVERLVLLGRGELGGLAADRVGADEGPRLHLDPQLSGADVVLDDAGKTWVSNSWQ